MKAIGYVRCLECGGLYRGYAPRGWQPGDPLCAWQHSEEDARHGFGRNARCAGSYKPGDDSRLDGDQVSAETTNGSRG
jgi:hypothetical protein